MDMVTYASNPTNSTKDHKFKVRPGSCLYQLKTLTSRVDLFWLEKEPSPETQSSCALILGFQPPWTINVCCLSHLPCGICYSSLS